MNTWEITILRILDSKNRIVSLKEIFKEIAMRIDLNDGHQEIRFNAPKYHHQIRAHIDDLLDKSELVRISRGTYSITSTGKKRIEGFQNT